MTAIFEDREGDLWLGGGSGIERLHDTPFTTYSRAQGMPSEGSGAIHVDRSDRVWFSPPEGGLYVLEGERVARVAAFGLGEDRVYSIAAAADGLWIGRQRGGLTHIGAVGGTLQARSYGEGQGLPRSSVYAVLEARDGSVWAGTLNGGLCRLQEGRVVTFTTSSGLPSNSVNALADTRDGALWVGTPSGLAVWSFGAWTTRGTRDGLPSADVTALLEDSEGVLWIGTSGGLALLRSGRVEVPGAASAPLREAILGIAEGEGGWLWIATARRVMRVRRAALLEGTRGRGRCRHLRPRRRPAGARGCASLPLGRDRLSGSDLVLHEPRAVGRPPTPRDCREGRAARPGALDPRRRARDRVSETRSSFHHGRSGCASPTRA